MTKCEQGHLSTFSLPGLGIIHLIEIRHNSFSPPSLPGWTPQPIFHLASVSPTTINFHSIEIILNVFIFLKMKNLICYNHTPTVITRAMAKLA